MAKWKIKTPMAAIRIRTSESCTLVPGEVIDVLNEDHAQIIFTLYNIEYQCASQILHDCASPFEIPSKKVEVAVETHEESEFFVSLQGSLEQAVQIKKESDIEILVEGTDPDVLEALASGSWAVNDDTFVSDEKHSVANAVQRLYDINDRYVRDFHIRLFSDGSMQIRESDEVDAEIVVEFADEQGFVVGDIHGNIQKWVDMIMDDGFVDHILNHKSSFAARYNLR